MERRNVLTESPRRPAGAKRAIGGFAVVACLIAGGLAAPSATGVAGAASSVMFTGQDLKPAVLPWGQEVQRRSIDVDVNSLMDQVMPGLPTSDGDALGFSNKGALPVSIELPGGKSVELRPTVTTFMRIPVLDEKGNRSADIDGVAWSSVAADGGPLAALAFNRDGRGRWELVGGTVELADAEYQIVVEDGRPVVQESGQDPDKDGDDAFPNPAKVDLPEGGVQRLLRSASRNGVRTQGVPAAGTDLRIMGVVASGISSGDATSYLTTGASQVQTALAASNPTSGSTGFTGVASVTITTALMTSYVESTTVPNGAADDVNAVHASTGALALVDPTRSSTSSDLITLVVPAKYTNPAICGGAWNPDNVSVVVRETTSVCYNRKAIPHEVGHNLGAAHDDAGPYGSGCVPATCSMEVTAGYPRSYGYNNGTKCDVNSVSTGCRQLIYSTPFATFPGGAVAGTSTRYNAEVVSDLVITTACYAGPAATGGTYTPVTPTRLLDTRYGTGGYNTDATPLALRQVAVPSSVPADAAAVVVNITAVNTTADGYLSAFECGDYSSPRSMLNFQVGRTRAQTAVVAMGEYRFFTLQASVATDEIVDLVGYYGGTGSGVQNNKLHPINTSLPIRAVDTRSANSGNPALYQGGMLPGGTSRNFNLALASPPAGTTIAVVNLTVTHSTTAGYLSLSTSGSGTSTLNYYPGSAETNLALVPVTGSTATFDVWTQTGTDLIVDVIGWFSPTGTLSYTACTPYRMIDASGLSVGAADLFPSNQAAIVNVVLANPSVSGGWLTVYPRPVPATPVGAPPSVSTVNGIMGENVNNHAIVHSSAGFRVYYSSPSGGTYRLVVDLEGCFN